MSAPIVAGRPGTLITPFVSNKLLHDRTEMSCWQGVNHGVRTSTSKPSWFSSCSCSSSAMTVSSVCCYRNTSRKMTTSTATDVAPGLSPKNGQIPPTDPDSGDDVCHIPQPVFSLFVYLAQQGGHVNDMFRRPGNITQMRQILQEFTSGNPVNWSDYNVYTVANVAKKLLLSIPDGLFGVRGEALLLSTASGSSCSTEVDELLDPVLSSRSVVAESHCSRLFPPGDQKTVTFADDLNPLGSVSSRLPRGSVIQLTQLSEVAERRIAVFLRVLESLPSSHRQFSILVFGLLHQLVMNATSSAASCSLSSLVDLSRSSGTLLPKREDAKDVGLAVAEVPLLVLAEGVVKSVAGALFHTCCSSIHLVEQAAQVLRTLVLFFPAMGDSVTRFFVEAVANRLPPRKTLTTDSGRPVASRSFCVLCPETGHTGHFGHHSDDKGGIRQCPLNLIHVASRLFCLSGWRTSPQQKSPLSPSTCLPPAKSSNLLPRLRCAPFSSKPQSSTSCSSTERVSLMTTVSSDMTSPVNASVHPTDNTDPSARAADEKAPQTDGTVNTEKDLPSRGPEIIVEKCVPTLRRNQSRYRSLRRRQMENLSRRAEWFLGPTVLPVVTLTPASAIPPDPLHRVVQLPQKKRDDFANSREMVVTSTVSLLDLDDSIRRELKDSAQLGGCHATSIQPPRLLFVASTGELEQQQQQQDFDIQSRDSCLVQRKDSGRQRLLSVGCYLNPTPADSFVSVYSAPSAGLHRFDATGPAVSVPSVNHPLEYRSAVSAAQFPSISSPSSQALDLQSQPAALFLHPRPPEALRVRQPRSLAEPPNYSVDNHILPAVVQSGSCFSLSTPQKLPQASHVDPIPIGMPENGGRPRSNSAWAALPLPTCAKSYASPYPSYEKDRSHHR